jgi:hypothetical protein
MGGIAGAGNRKSFEIDICITLLTAIFAFLLMREILTDKRFIVSKTAVVLKYLLIAALLIFCLPLFILPFYNHASADDYVYGYQFYKSSFWTYQKYIYSNWSGGFSATFLSSLFLFNHYLYHHYYLHSLLLLMCNYLSAFLLIQTINKYVLKIANTNLVLLFSFIYTAIIIVCVPELLSLLFWFSSALIYFTGIILIQFELWLFILLYYTSNSVTKILCLIFLPILIFVTNGFSEVFEIVQLSILSLFFVTGFLKKFSKGFLITLIIFFTISFLISFFAPGNYMGSQAIFSISFPTSIAAILFGVIEVLFTIFKSSLLWFVMVTLFLYGNYKKEKFPADFIKNSSRYIKILFFVTVLFLVVSICEGVFSLKGRIVPDRFINIICWFTTLLLLAIVFFCGTALKTNLIFNIKDCTSLTALCYAILILVLCSNNYIGTAYKSVLSAPVYSSIMSSRENILEKASHKKNYIPVVKSYDLAFREYMEKNHPASTATYLKWLQQKPMLIFNDNGDTDDCSILTIKNFYNVDSVIIKK